MRFGDPRLNHLGKGPLLRSESDEEAAGAFGVTILVCKEQVPKYLLARIVPEEAFAMVSPTWSVVSFDELVMWFLLLSCEGPKQPRRHKCLRNYESGMKDETPTASAFRAYRFTLLSRAVHVERAGPLSCN